MFKSAATKIAHNSTLPALAINQDLRPLQDLITAEKAVILSLQRLATDLSKAAEALKSWGLGEGDDLGDILTASTTILTHFTSALSQYAAHGHSMREQLKSIRSREEALDELRRRRRNVNSKADAAEKKLSKMSFDHKNYASQTELLNRLRDEIRGLDYEIMKDGAAIGDFKRSSTRMWVGLKFGGLIECCEKGVIAGEYGKLIVSEIPDEQTQPGLPRPPYLAHSRIGDLVAEAHRCVNEVRLSTVPSTALPPQQQLPQVPHVPDSPFMSQGGYSHRLTESYSDDPSRLQSPPGRFESPADSPIAPSPQHHYSNSLSNTVLPSSLSGRRVDEFGSSIEGGRFATFPVKARSGSTSGAEGGGGAPFSLLATPPPPDRPQSDSFSSSVAQALAATTTTTTNEPITPPKPGKDEPAPSYEVSVDLERGQSSGGGEESQLGYVTTEQEDSQRHVHFGAADVIPDVELSGAPSRLGQQARLARLLQNEDEDQDNSTARNEQSLDAAAAREVALELADGATGDAQQQPALQMHASPPEPLAPGVVEATELERAPTYTEKPVSYHNQYGVGSSPPQQQQQQAPYAHHHYEYPQQSYSHQQAPTAASASAPPLHLYQAQQNVYPVGGGGYGAGQEQEFYNPYSEQRDAGSTGGGGVASPPPSSSPVGAPQPQFQLQPQPQSPVQALPSGAYPPYNQARQASPPPPLTTSPQGDNNNNNNDDGDVKPRSPVYERPPNALYMGKPESGERSTSSLGSLTPGAGGGGGGGGKISAAAFKRPSPRLGAGTMSSGASASASAGSAMMGQGTEPLRIGKSRSGQLQQQQQQQEGVGEGGYGYIGAYLNENEGGEGGGEREKEGGRGGGNVGAGVGTYYYEGYGGGGGGAQGKFGEDK